MKSLDELRKEQINLIGFDPYDQEQCLAAVKRNGCALQYVKDQTPEICLAAVKQDGYSLRYVKDQTPEICLEAVKRNGFVIC